MTFRDAIRHVGTLWIDKNPLMCSPASSAGCPSLVNNPEAMPMQTNQQCTVLSGEQSQSRAQTARLKVQSAMSDLLAIVF
jgi:hypothetical protein